MKEPLFLPHLACGAFGRDGVCQSRFAARKPGSSVLDQFEYPSTSVPSLEKDLTAQVSKMSTLFATNANHGSKMGERCRRNGKDTGETTTLPVGYRLLDDSIRVVINGLGPVTRHNHCKRRITGGHPRGSRRRNYLDANSDS
jgi:hypothetical protein